MFAASHDLPIALTTIQYLRSWFALHATNLVLLYHRMIRTSADLYMQVLITGDVEANSHSTFDRHLVSRSGSWPESHEFQECDSRLR